MPNITHSKDQSYQLWLAHSARTAIGAVASYCVADLTRTSQPYWASITAIIVMHSTLGSSWVPSKERFAGTAAGAGVAAFVATAFRPNILIYGASILVLGLVCRLIRLDRNAYRFAGMAFSMVVLLSGSTAPWLAAIERFTEVAIGIVIGLVVTALWPEKDDEKSS